MSISLNLKVTALTLLGVVGAAGGQVLTASDAASGDSFGTAVAVSGNLLVVGAQNAASGLLANAGALYVFSKGVGGWSEAGIEQPTAPAAGDRVGSSLAINGTWVFAGATNRGVSATPPGDNFGCVYAFQVSGTDLTQVQEIRAGDAAAFDFFGTSVASSMDTLAIGSPADDDLGNESGSVYVYTLSGATWTFLTKLNASDGVTGDRLGRTAVVTDRGGTIIAGARQALSGPGGVQSGAAYIFRRNNGVWSQAQKIVPQDPTAFDFFGDAISVSENLMVIGAQNDDDRANNAGAVYIYRLQGSTWTFLQKLTADDGVANDLFGQTAVVAGTQILVGARNNKTYVFSKCQSGFVQSRTLGGSGGSATVAPSLSMDEVNIIAGNQFANSNAGNVLTDEREVFNCSSCGFPTILHVNASAVGSNQCGDSWANAMLDLSDALDTARLSGGAVQQIWVAQGEYHPDRGTLNRSFTFDLPGNCTILGGFDGTESMATERDPGAHPTFLSGDLLSDDATPGNTADNSSIIVSAIAADGVMLDGFTISGAIEGHGMYIQDAAPSVVDCTFSNNHTSRSGAGAAVVGASDPTFEVCEFSGNTAGLAPQGGDAVMIDGASATFQTCVFQQNGVNDNARGGAIRIDGDGGVATIDNCTFSENSGGGAIVATEGAAADIQGGNFFRNRGATGGAIYGADATFEVQSATFRENRAGQGGAVYLEGGVATITNSTFADNRATSRGGALYIRAGGMASSIIATTFSGNIADSQGGAMYMVANAKPIVQRCTFSANSSPVGSCTALNGSDPDLINCLMINGAGAGAAVDAASGSRPDVINCTISGNSAGGLRTAADSRQFVTNCIVWGNMGASITGPATVASSDVQGGASGDGNINADPLFVSSGTGNFRLGSNSPAIDAGDNAIILARLITTDLAGLSRRMDVMAVSDTGLGTAPIVDMGAYEAESEPVNPCPCDWNGFDGLDSQDFFDFLDSFFNGDADFNGFDGTDSQDYFDFLECFFTGC